MVLGCQHQVIITRKPLREVIYTIFALFRKAKREMCLLANFRRFFHMGIYIYIYIYGLLRDSSDLQENSSMEKIQPCKYSLICCHLEILSFLLMSAGNTETLTFFSLKHCFLDFVCRPNECLYSYL